MLEALEMGISLEVVQWFQSIRFGLLDSLALLFHNANDGLFYIIVISTIYWMYNKKLGMRMLFALVTIGLITLAFKDLFARPRPYQILGGGIIPLITEYSYGIPSGHTSMALVIWGYVALWVKNRTITIAVIAYVILMGLSRIYLGVHFPHDVIAGWLLGGIVLWLYVTHVERIVTWWHEQPCPIQLLLPVVIGSVSTLFFLNSIDGLTFIGLLMGIGIAVTIETHYINFTPKDDVMHRFAQLILGLIVALVILEGLDMVFDAIAPPTYAYVEHSDQAIITLEAETETSSNTPTEVCTSADDDGLETSLCEETVTPISAGLRILRYGLLGLFAMGIIPLLSIRANLMKREETI